MAENTLNAELIGNMFLAGVSRLNAEKEWINELNVFPVPDGDTGTNMSMTMLSAANAVMELSDKNNMADLCKAMSSGSLRGARGNSGVILSQLLRGFAKQLSELDEVGTTELSLAFARAVETAYKAVMKPKEGTILTVAKGISQKASEICEEVKDPIEFADQVISYGEEVLAKTPDMLPVLKQAGVVDSGGQGLILLLKGAYDFHTGKVTAEDFSFTFEKAPAARRAMAGVTGHEEIRFGYCTEFIIQLERNFNQKSEADLKSYLESIGDSIVCVAMDDIVKIHVHTNDPGLAIQKALKYGQLSCMKIDNMRLEHHERVLKSEELRKAGVKNVAGDNDAEAKVVPIKNTERKHSGFICVSVGDGMNAIFESLGVDCIIPGGQTMNPSTEDMLKAVSEVNADTVFVLPNNKNIILAANQAKALCTDKKVIVLPTTTAPQGIAALIAFMEEESDEENERTMTEAASLIKTGQVTYAVRDTSIDDKEIKQGDIMGIGDKAILAVGSDIESVAADTVAGMTDDETSLISVYFGEDVSEEEASALGDILKKEYPGADVEVNNGGQPIYYYIISVE
ncbi:MAG: DAK2 domain-containing protein [Lachnospiraceae bacterium]|nr:DAK2 domain-containing protein [Lachnospiraceae bacterium]